MADTQINAAHLLPARSVSVHPYSKAWIGGPDHAQIPEHGRIRKGGAFEDMFPDTLRSVRMGRLQGRYLYGGPLKIHFGHILVDSVIRLYAFDRSIHDGVVFAALNQGPIPQWAYDIFALFGLKPEDIIVIHEATSVEALDFAEPGSVLKRGPAPWYLEWLKGLPLEPRPGMGAKLYFGRTHMIATGTLMGESYFGALLQDAGFRYVRPECFNIHQQAAMIRQASEIVFAEGSAIYTAELLAMSEARVFMFPRRRSPRLFEPHLAPRSRGFHVLGNIIALKRKENRSGNIRPNSPSFTDAPESIHADMVHHGLVCGRFSRAGFKEAEAGDYAQYMR